MQGSFVCLLWFLLVVISWTLSRQNLSGGQNQFVLYWGCATKARIKIKISAKKILEYKIPGHFVHWGLSYSLPPPLCGVCSLWHLMFIIWTCFTWITGDGNIFETPQSKVMFCLSLTETESLHQCQCVHVYVVLHSTHVVH